MLKYVAKRLGSSVLVLVGASILLYFLVTVSGDPLEDLQESTDHNRETLIAQRTRWMNLDMPWYQRYFRWLQGVGGCFRGACDFGFDRAGQRVTDAVGQAAVVSLRLVILATLLSIVIGIIIGIVTAIRQYSAFDYVTTFLAFVFFSLPSFWLAVLLKEYGAIRYNDWIASGRISTTAIILISIGLGLALQFIMGGSVKRRLFTGGVSTVVAIGALFYFDNNNWFREPHLGLPLVFLATAGAAVLAIALFSTLKSKRVVYAAIGTIVGGAVVALVFNNALAGGGIRFIGAGGGSVEFGGWAIIFAIGLALLIVGLASAFIFGGDNRGQAVGINLVTVLVLYILLIANQAVGNWANYLGLQSRPISTIGAQTPNFSGNFWETFIDSGTQLILPTVALTLISIAGYTRYTRASMLEVLNQDYVRTARAKGLSERVVITKHAFRNALIPLTTIVALDFAALVGGAVITEQIFGWKGMGELFRTGLENVDPNPVMAFFLVTGTAAVLMNLLADLVYGALDPRIRR